MGMYGVGKYMKLWKQWDIDACPRCVLREDAQHVWWCKTEETEILWESLWNKLA
jgi:hypothetical protein